MSESVRVLTDANWETDVLRAPGPVLVDFWASGCPPCRLLAPEVAALAGSGLAVVSQASTASSVLAFLIARHLARHRVESLARSYPRFRAIDAAIAEGGFRVVALLRLSPAMPFSAGNYLFGLTGVGFSGSVPEYVALHVPKLRDALDADRHVKVRWIPYDWSLNEKSSSECSRSRKPTRTDPTRAYAPARS